jgi:hypothetical protein
MAEQSHVRHLADARLGHGLLAALVVHRCDPCAVLFHQVQLGRDSQPHRTQADRSGMDALGLGELAGALVHPPVLDRAVHRVGVVRALALHPLRAGQARAGHVLVGHPQ